MLYLFLAFYWLARQERRKLADGSLTSRLLENDNDNDDEDVRTTRAPNE
jgi:hypothetical protein